MSEIKKILFLIFEFLRNNIYRKLVFLSFLSKNKLKVNGFSIVGNDIKSFVSEFDHIFYREEYFFESNKTDPLIIDCGAKPVICSVDKNLHLDLTDLDEILTTFIVKDLNVSPSDSSYIIASILTGDTIFKANIQSEVIFSSIDSVKFIWEIKKVIFKAENFEGKLEYQLIKNPNL